MTNGKIIPETGEIVNITINMKLMRIFTCDPKINIVEMQPTKVDKDELPIFLKKLKIFCFSIFQIDHFLYTWRYLLSELNSELNLILQHVKITWNSTAELILSQFLDK